MKETTSISAPSHFPLFEGGPFARLQGALRLAGTEKRYVRRRLVFVILGTWVPLVMLAAAQDRAIGASWRDSMLLDPEIYARYLVALPLLILATPEIRRKLQTVVNHFLDAGLVKDSERESFFANIVAMLRWRDSAVAAVVLIALAVAKAVTFGTISVAEMSDSWRVVGSGGNRGLSLSGWWLVVVCEPLFMTAMLQLLYRLTLWWRFLWETSHLDLQLTAAHPDGAGGLAFLGMVLPAFCLPIFAIAASIAGAVANLMLWMNASFESFQYAIAAFAVALLALTAGPLAFFSRQLYKTKEHAMLAYGGLAMRLLRAFEKKWLGTSPATAGEMLQTADFSVVSDFNATGTTVQKMKMLPFGPKQLISPAIAVLLPFLPVVVIEIPMKEILLQVMQLLK